jgi:predicted Na+-dependent transporter
LLHFLLENNKKGEKVDHTLLIHFQMARETSALEEFFVALVLGLLNVVAWVREQWLLWLMLGSIGAAYFSPVVLALSLTPLVASICTASTFFLTGLTLPIAEMRSLYRHWALMMLVVCQCFVVSPLIGMAIYNVPLVTSEASHALLVTGLLCSCWLPTPMLVSSIATAAAGGNESVSQAVSVVVNILGLIGISPLGIQLTMRHTGALLMPTSSDSILSFVWMFAVTTIVPLLVGHCLQQALQSTSLRHLVNSDEQLKRQVTNATVTCSEVCDTSQSTWRSRARQLSIGTLLLLNYVVFSASFHHSASVQRELEAAALMGQSSPPHHAVAASSVRDKDLTWSALGIMVLAVFGMQVTQALLSWLGMALCCQAAMSPEERIAAFFLSFQKSELLALPLLIQICACSASDPKTAAFLVLPSIAVHLTQSVLGGMLTHPLRIWRNRQHCRPGTTLLPLRYTKVPKHALPAGASSAPYFTNSHAADGGSGGM